MSIETLAAQPLHEQRKSYEPLASANLLRYDVENLGAVRPETRDRVCDEELSYLVEGIDQASRTSFVLQRRGDEVTYFDEGQWKNYKGLLYTGLDVAWEEAAQDPRRRFLIDRANEDLVNGNIMCSLQPGEQHVWFSLYEYDIEDQYGTQFMQECGRQPERQMGFLYRASCQDDGNILLESQTIDHIDTDGCVAMIDAVEQDPNITTDELVNIYDTSIYAKDGVDRYAGRPKAERDENAWDEIHKHRDLIEYHLNTLEKIVNSNLTGGEFKAAIKKHTYGVWAAFKKRIEGEVKPQTTPGYAPVSHTIDPHLHALLEQETRAAFKDFASQGKVMVGCGGGFGMVSGETDIMNANGSDLHSSIFGGDKYGSLTFTCPNGHHNKRPHGKLIDACQHKGCKAQVACK